MKVVLTNDEGRTFDVTEHFRVLYDNVVQSMDWGSGFLDGGEALLVMQAGAAAGFQVDASTENLVNAFNIRAEADRSNREAAIAAGIRPGSSDWEAFRHRGVDTYYALRAKREKWIAEQLGDPPTWDSIEAYRARLAEWEAGS